MKWKHDERSSKWQFIGAIETFAWNNWCQLQTICIVARLLIEIETEELPNGKYTLYIQTLQVTNLLINW